MQESSRESRVLIVQALEEDLGPDRFDATTMALASEAQGTAQLRTREPCRVAGVELAREVFHHVDEQVAVEIVLPDGSDAQPGDTLLTVSGTVTSILTAERTALNFLQRLCGVATLTRRFVEAANRPEMALLDTRKTTPGWRALEKAAVVCGGGTNHRMGLYDAIMIKDNHVALWGGGTIADAVCTARARFPELKIEVEVDTLEQLEAVLPAKPDWVLLDNMTLETLQEAVERCDGRCQTEASGGITLETIGAIAATGVDAVSVGALTHAAVAIDLGLDVDECNQ
jgi:nicotinate-nucleotide pyrophosphorylase (carboxylating)